MVESKTRKAAFLSEAARTVELPAVVENARFEEVAARGLRRADDAGHDSGRARGSADADHGEEFPEAGGKIALFSPTAASPPELPPDLRVVRIAPLLGYFASRAAREVMFHVEQVCFQLPASRLRFQLSASSFQLPALSFQLPALGSSCQLPASRSRLPGFQLPARKLSGSACLLTWLPAFSSQLRVARLTASAASASRLPASSRFRLRACSAADRSSSQHPAPLGSASRLPAPAASFQLQSCQFLAPGLPASVPRLPQLRLPKAGVPAFSSSAPQLQRASPGSSCGARLKMPELPRLPLSAVSQHDQSAAGEVRARSWSCCGSRLQESVASAPETES